VITSDGLAKSLADVISSGRGGYVSLLTLSRAVMIAGERKQKDRDALVLAITTCIVDSVAGNNAVSGEGQSTTSSNSSSDMTLDSFMVASYDELPSLARYEPSQSDLITHVMHHLSLIYMVS
jgi:hypothetical protein